MSYVCAQLVTHDSCTQTDGNDPIHANSKLSKFFFVFFFFFLRSICCLTHYISSTIFIKDARLKELDQFYGKMSGDVGISMLTSGSGGGCVNEKLAEFERRVEEKARADADKRMAEWRDTELTRMRLEERASVRNEMQASRAELEANYRARLEALSARDKQLDEWTSEKKRALEREMHEQREHLLAEAKQMREREAYRLEAMQAQLKACETEQKRVEERESLVRRREETLHLAEADLAARAKEERERARVELDREYSQRTFLMQTVEAANRAAALQLQVERGKLEGEREQQKAQLERMHDAETQLRRAHAESATLRQENEMVKERLQRMIDYDIVLQENKMLRSKLEATCKLMAHPAAALVLESTNHASIHDPLQHQAGQLSDDLENVCFVDNNKNRVGVFFPPP